LLPVYLYYVIALVDCNNFYVSCERVFQPALNRRPVVVLSNNDGCIIARSQEAKDLGIPMGAVAHQWHDVLQQNKVEVFSSNYALYGDMSARVSQTLQTFAADTEPYSIDESFLDFRGMNIPDYTIYGCQIRKTVLRNIGIPVSVGIASTKTLAKMANHFAKKDKRYAGVCVIDTDVVRIDLLRRFPVREVWGIGSRYARMLEASGIHTAYDLAVAPEGFVRKQMTVTGVRLQTELRGSPCIELETEMADKKNICTSRSFGVPVTSKDELSEAVATYASRCALKLRRQHTHARSLLVFVHTNRFQLQDAQYAGSYVVQLPLPSHSAMLIARYARKALDIIFREGFRYKKAGVIVMDLVSDQQVQTSLFQPVDYRPQDQVMKVMDSLNNRYGRNTVKLAGEGINPRWKLRQERLSPCFTTRWTDIMVVKNLP
jgi:DNA polymerase V